MTRYWLPLVLLLASCGGASSPTTSSSSGTAGSTSASCTTLGQCTFVRDALQQYYYWYQELPNPDPASFGSPEAYLDSVRYRTLDSTYSYITSKASSDAFFSDSQFIGFGLSYKRTGDLELRLTQTFPGSPAAEAGLDRGHYLVAVNGKSVADLIRTGEIATVFGPEQVGVTAEIAWRAPGGPEQRATLSQAAGDDPHRLADRGDRRRAPRASATSTSATSCSPPSRRSTPPSSSCATRERRSSCSTCATTAAGSSRWRSTWRG